MARIVTNKRIPEISVVIKSDRMNKEITELTRAVVEGFMTDLELTWLCAEAMDVVYKGGIPSVAEKRHLCWPECFDFQEGEHGGPVRYDPLHDDAQAMALVKKFGLFLGRFKDGHWCVDPPDQAEQLCSFRSTDLNRAIVECVAKMKSGNR